MSIKAIITGTTGMVGKAALLECLDHPEVESILIINRRSIDIKYPKLKEVIHKDFFNLEAIESELKGYNACFFCLGVSSVGMSEEDFTKMTFTLTTTFAEAVKRQNPEGLVFNYVSGTGTDTSEKGKTMWARVKGHTENTILNMGFKDAYMFRPGIILPEKGIKSSTALYNTAYVILWPFYFLFRMSKSNTTTTKVGLAMINSVLRPQELKHLEGKDINEMAEVK